MGLEALDTKVRTEDEAASLSGGVPVLVEGRIKTLDELTSLFRQPGGAAVDKQLDHINDGMAAFIDRAPFLAAITGHPDAFAAAHQEAAARSL